MICVLSFKIGLILLLRVFNYGINDPYNFSDCRVKMIFQFIVIDRFVEFFGEP